MALALSLLAPFASATARAQEPAGVSETEEASEDEEPEAEASTAVLATSTSTGPGAIAPGEPLAPAGIDGAAAPEETLGEVPSSPGADPAIVGVDAVAAPDGATLGEAEPESHWYDDISILAFADTYFAGHWTLPNPVQGDRTDYLGHRAYDANGGLALAFAGLDVSYDGGMFGATVNLRFGQAVPRLLGAFSGLPEGMQFLKQAFVSWRPVEQLQIDFGQFDTIYGAEVSESWLNPTYTRGALYNVIQPFYHAGFRVAWTPTEEITVRAILVNGWNNVLDDNDGKSVGVQFAWGSGPLSFSIGYLTGPEGAGNNELFRHLVDALATLDLGAITLYANADFVTEDTGGGVYQSQGGGMLAARIPMGDFFGLGLRGEYLHFGAVDQGLGTATLTLEALPAELIVIRLDNRLDIATDERFIDPSSQPSQFAVSSVLGVVVHSE